MVTMCIPANLSKPESGTKFLKKWDFRPESGALLRNLAKIAKITKFIWKKLHKKSQKIGTNLILSFLLCHIQCTVDKF